jgi:hypothetical protein
MIELRSILIAFACALIPLAVALAYAKWGV